MPEVDVFLIFLLVALLIIYLLNIKTKVIEEKFVPAPGSAISPEFLQNPDEKILVPRVQPFFKRDINARYEVNPAEKQPDMSNLLNGGIYKPLIYEPGANNTYGDLIWNYTSPRMVLVDTCLDCNKWQPGKDYNPPSGSTDNLSSQFSRYAPDGTALPGAFGTCLPPM